MECNITGVKTLRLAIAGNPRIDGGWGTWGGALISKSGNITDEMMYTDYFADLYKPDPTPEISQTTAPADTELDNEKKPVSSPEIKDKSIDPLLIASLSFLGGIVLTLAVALIIKGKRRR